MAAAAAAFFGFFPETSRKQKIQSLSRTSSGSVWFWNKPEGPEVFRRSEDFLFFVVGGATSGRSTCSSEREEKKEV